MSLMSPHSCLWEAGKPISAVIRIIQGPVNFRAPLALTEGVVCGAAYLLPDAVYIYQGPFQLPGLWHAE